MVPCNYLCCTSLGSKVLANPNFFNINKYNTFRAAELMCERVNEQLLIIRFKYVFEIYSLCVKNSLSYHVLFLKKILIV